MRILHTVHSFHPESFGGTETYVRAIADAQRSAGHSVWIFSGSESGGPGNLRQDSLDGLQVLRMPCPSRSPLDQLVGTSPILDRAMQKVVQEIRADVVHVHHWHNSSRFVGRIARSLGARVILSLHDLFLTCPLFFRLPDGTSVCEPDLPINDCACCVLPLAGIGMAELEQGFRHRQHGFREELRQAHQVLVLSRVQKAFLRRVPWLRDTPLIVLPLPRLNFGPAMRTPLRNISPSEHQPLRLVSWGALVRGKGMNTVVKAMGSLSDPTRISLDHFGRILDPEFLQELEVLSEGLAVRFHGPFRTEQRSQQFADFDLAIFPSHFLETHGFVVDEALHLGLPVLVSDRGAPCERVGERGRSFPAGDTTALRHILQELQDDRRALSSMRSGTAPGSPTLDEHMRQLMTLIES